MTGKIKPSILPKKRVKALAGVYLGWKFKLSELTQ